MDGRSYPNPYVLDFIRILNIVHMWLYLFGVSLWMVFERGSIATEWLRRGNCLVGITGLKPGAIESVRSP